MKDRGFKAFALFAILVMALGVTGAAFAAPTAAPPTTGEGTVCPDGNVKWETDGGYEYTDGSATVEGDENTVTVEAADGYEIVSVCIKIGGPDGGSLLFFDSGGTFGPFDYGISHVVVVTEQEEPTETPVPTETPTPTDTPEPTETPTPTATATPTEGPSPTPTTDPCLEHPEQCVTPTAPPPPHEEPKTGPGDALPIAGFAVFLGLLGLAGAGLRYALKRS